jgi:hypothetical protein
MDWGERARLTSHKAAISTLAKTGISSTLFYEDIATSVLAVTLSELSPLRHHLLDEATTGDGTTGNKEKEKMRRTG